jgi:hypothetical protein
MHRRVKNDRLAAAGYLSTFAALTTLVTVAGWPPPSAATAITVMPASMSSPPITSCGP